MRPRLLTAKRAARYLGMDVSTFGRWRKDEHQPALPLPVSTRGRDYFVLEELDSFVDSLKSLRGAPAR